MKHNRPYGENNKTAQWAKERGLHYTPSGRCIHWLIKGRCNEEICTEGGSSGINHRWMDHVSGWIGKDGGRLLLFQPYHQSTKSLVDLAETCKKFDLVGHVTGDGWYGYGTIAIELITKEQCEKESRAIDERLKREEMARMAKAGKKVADAAMGSSK